MSSEWLTSNLAMVVAESQGKQTPRRGWIEGVLAGCPTGVVAMFPEGAGSGKARRRAVTVASAAKTFDFDDPGKRMAHIQTSDFL